MGVTKAYAAKQFFNAALVGCIAYVTSGAYGDMVDREARQVVLEMDPAFQLQSQNAHLSDRDWQQIDCLARNMYFEARNQPDEGMAAVSDVVFNRIEEAQYPGSPCEVITQHGQFSWYEDGKPHVMTDKYQMKRSYRIALKVWEDRPIHYKETHKDQTGGATNYHADYVAPTKGVWASAKFVKQIGAHMFYKKE